MLGGFELGDQSATLQVVVNPLVNWIWLGFGIMALGTGIALLPERAFAFALAKLPAEAAATTVALLLRACCCRAARRCRRSGHGRRREHAHVVLRAQRRSRSRCSTRSSAPAAPAATRRSPSAARIACGTSHEMRGELAAMIDQGKNHDEIIQAFIAKYGSEEMLGAPLDKGFNRLAWLFPYLVGATSAVAVGFAAVKWTRKPDAAAAAPRADRLRARRAPRR